MDRYFHQVTTITWHRLKVSYCQLLRFDHES